MSDYWDSRAREYEEVYRREDPVRRAELAAIRDALCEAVVGQRVIELACGTGYWTPAIAEVAEFITAIDTSAEMLDIAREKPLPPGKEAFRLADVYALQEVPGTFDAAVMISWLSHVQKARLGKFLGQLHTRLEPGAIIFMADNVYVPGVGGELVTRPDDEDTFKRRTLADGSRHEIVKNYYDRGQLRVLLEPRASKLGIHMGQCYWWLTCSLSGQRVSKIVCGGYR